MVFKTIKSIIKICLLACFIILLIGYPLVMYETNPFTFYYDKMITVFNGIKQIKNIT